MKKGFTIVEVSILFVIFLIVAFLVAPLSLNDTVQAKNTSRWRGVQQDFHNISQLVLNEQEEGQKSYAEIFESIIENETKESIKPYKIMYLNGVFPDKNYRFEDFRITYSNAVIAFKNLSSDNKLKGMLMYDVNGQNGPNVWGKDVFGLNIYENNFEPFGASKPISEQKKNCSRNENGLYCSNYYLIGGSFD